MHRSACTSILVGKKATFDGSVMIGRNEDSRPAWPKHLVFYPHTLSGVQQFTSKANHFTCKLPSEQAQYSATPEWTDQYGIFAEDGINEYQVAMSATESAYANARVQAYDPFNEESGILEEAMVTVTLPYIKSARAGVLRLGELVTHYGAAEANGILFADIHEAWYMEIGSGHHWVAQRIPDDAYAVVANQLSIEVIDFESDTFITSPSLQEFAQKHHLWAPGTDFNFRQIFGTLTDSDYHYNLPRVWSGQRRLTPSQSAQPNDWLHFCQYPDHPVQLEEVFGVLSDHYQGTAFDPTTSSPQAHYYRPISLANTQESHVLHLRPSVTQPGLHWLALGVTAESNFVPFYPLGLKTPTGYDKGTDTYDAASAYWIFKEAGVLVDRYWHSQQRLLQATQTSLHAHLLQLVAETDQKLDQAVTTKEITSICDASNERSAQLALTAYQGLTAHLITQQTSRSPLQFKVDPNL